MFNWNGRCVEEMVERFEMSGVGKKLINNDAEFGQKMIDHLRMYNYKCLEKDPKEYEIDKILGKQIIVHLNIFFNNPRRNKTIKNRRRQSAKNQKTKRNNTHTRHVDNPERHYLSV